MGFFDIIAAVSAVIGLLILIGGGIALIKGSYNKARIEALHQDITAYQNRTEALEGDLERQTLKHDGEIKACGIREQALEDRCSHLETENHTLRELVTQRADVAEVSAQLATNHQEIIQKWTELTALLTVALAEDRNDHT